MTDEVTCPRCGEKIDTDKPIWEGNQIEHFCGAAMCTKCYHKIILPLVEGFARLGNRTTGYTKELK